MNEKGIEPSDNLEMLLEEYLDKKSKIEDHITLKQAIEEPIWQIMLIDEPKRTISVAMTYEDLYIITKLIKEHRENDKHCEI